MKILSADTATTILTVAVSEGEQVLAETVLRADRKHSERLLDTAHWVLSECGLTLDAVEALAISTGPGSFTGLRVGVSAWKGLALGADLPLVAVPTLDAMTRLGVSGDGLVCPLLDAKMGEVFGAVYRFEGGVRTKLAEDRVCPVEKLLEELDGSVLFVGDGAALYRERIKALIPGASFASSPCDFPRASAVALEAAFLLAQGVSTDPDSVSPVYLRKSQAEVNQARTASS